MKKIVKIFLIIVLCFLITMLSFKYVDNIKADSGWDSDYDSSWDSGSSWDNDYDYDYDYDYDNDYDYDYSGGSGSGRSSCSGEGCQVNALLAILAVCTIYFGIPFLIISITRSNTKNKRDTYENKMREMFISFEEEYANKIIPNFNIKEFNFKAYQIFYGVQMAWMDFDYDKLKNLLTDELYNNYVMQLDALKLKKHKNVMKGFELIETRLTSLKEENDKYIAEVYLNVRFFDYVENNFGMILRGSHNRKLNNIYKLTFVRTKENSNNINECPSCGAPVEGNATGVCEYCKSKLVNDNHDWVMSKKEKVN